jgi:hypothetical protein
MSGQILVSAKSEQEEALNIIIESGSGTDRIYPGVGNGAIGDIKISLVHLGFNTEDATKTTIVDDKLIWGTFGAGISQRETNNGSSVVLNQGQDAILLSAAGFAKNTAAFWTAISPTLKLEAFDPNLLVDTFNVSQSHIHRVFFLDDLQQTEPYLSLFVPLFTSIN